MSSIIFGEEVLDRLKERHPRFHETAYLFTLSALHYVLDRLPEPRHISGRELAEGMRDLALERFGPMARSVLEYWGIQATADLGELVFALGHPWGQPWAVAMGIVSGLGAKGYELALEFALQYSRGKK